MDSLRHPVRKVIKRRNNVVLQSLELPVFINLNPRSIYNKTEDFKLLVDQYEADVICISESWEREDLTLKELLDLDNFEVFTNVKQRDFAGGKPAIVVNTEKYDVKPLCPEPITVPVGVEAVWVLIMPKSSHRKSSTKIIIVASIYYRGPKSTKKAELFDHIAQSFHLLSAKYGHDAQFLIAGDTNRLSLSPITDLSPRLKQLVKVPTRLNPDAILDPIISTLGKWYLEPVTKPPINADEGGKGKPSDHLVVLMQPLVSALEVPPRQYRTVVTRPLRQSGIESFGRWIVAKSWKEIYQCDDINRKVEIFQNTLMDQYLKCFPEKVLKVCDNDAPWITPSLKALDRKRKREFLKHKKSLKWKQMNEEFRSKVTLSKKNYYENIVTDLKNSNPSKWYSKVKRMTGKNTEMQNPICVDDLIGIDEKKQAEMIADHYSKISNQYSMICKDDFSQYINGGQGPFIEPLKVYNIIKSANKKAATVPGDLPMKLIAEFAVELSFPLAHIFNCCIETGVYPDMFKRELVTPVPKIFPPQKMSDLRKISGLYNFSKIMDKILGEFIIADMSKTRDLSQFGNEKKMSRHHYLIQMLHRILISVEKNSKNEAFAVILEMIDWSQAFDRLSHDIGVRSFLKNGVRHSLIPILVNYYENRNMQVKWNGKISTTRSLNGGGTQGGLMGILEYLSQTNDNVESIPLEDRYKFIDDLSILDILNLVNIGLASFNARYQVPSDVAIDRDFLPMENTKSHEYLEAISSWTHDNQMKINTEKSKYMIINFTENYQFSTRLTIEDKPLQQVREARLLGVLISDDLSWKSNTQHTVKQAYKRMIILYRLSEFLMPIDDLIDIYKLYIRSILESSAVVWHSAITEGERHSIERVQKVALKIILKSAYIDYEDALAKTHLETLEKRREVLCLRFATACTKNPKTQKMFPLNPSRVNTRHHEKYYVQPARTSRLKNSPIPYMQRLLNAGI